jgi:acyl-CoA hydrolase
VARLVETRLAEALIAVADPRHRDALSAEARRRFGSW